MTSPGTIQPEQLRQMSAFGALSDAFIERLLTQGQLLRLKKGEILYRKGEPADCFFIVMQGHVTVYDDTDLGGMLFAPPIQAKVSVFRQ
jgi:CRP-like cAMP-binding protein